MTLLTCLSIQRLGFPFDNLSRTQISASSYLLLFYGRVLLNSVWACFKDYEYFCFSFIGTHVRRAPLHLARAVSGPCSASHRQMDLDWQSEKTVILKLPLSCSIKSWKERRSQRPETDHLAILPRDRSWSSSR